MKTIDMIRKLGSQAAVELEHQVKENVLSVISGKFQTYQTIKEKTDDNGEIRFVRIERSIAMKEKFDDEFLDFMAVRIKNLLSRSVISPDDRLSLVTEPDHYRCHMTLDIKG